MKWHVTLLQSYIDALRQRIIFPLASARADLAPPAHRIAGSAKVPACFSPGARI